MINIRPLNKPLRGVITVPADKSITHRAVIFAAISNAAVELSNCLDSADIRATVDCLRALGTDIKQDKNNLLVTGRGFFSQPAKTLNAQNSGTTVRLLTGLLAAQNLNAIFIGDDSLSKRPMKRVIDPLKKMGANISARENNFLPVNIAPAKLHGIEYTLPVPSAQVKSAILLAGLFADGITTVIEPTPSRNHTELMLAAFNAPIKKFGNKISVSSAKLSAPPVINIPADISSAAFFIVLASILPNSQLTIKNVGVNPTRTGLIDALNKMGADIHFSNLRRSANEPVADLSVAYSSLRATDVTADATFIDEIPALAVAAAFAEGTTVIRNLSELRVKESDRLAAIVNQFNKFAPGAFQAQDDTLIIHGRLPFHFARADSLNDHRIAMSLAVFAAAANGAIIDNERCVDISFPNFFSFF